MAGSASQADVADAVKDADLVIEAVSENLVLKRDLWAKVGAAAPEKTIFTTNTSSLLPSLMADATGRPDRFLALHYANPVYLRNLAEVMSTDQTDPNAYQQVVTFAEENGLEPIPVKKEQPVTSQTRFSSPRWAQRSRCTPTGSQTYRRSTRRPEFRAQRLSAPSRSSTWSA
ncbi:3-hydroxyacyl-CoA dehydrogenase NAD-binding domain-containing protein [Nocardia sp. NPDC050412]|uniref:3-hydroxyacyl-CoA dehydrogenase NAD-binding domain-containing protein n=1 Tax=Nocardia sp. NPDC050412 TaxID=3364320 RepID=UPI003796CBB9